MGFSWYSVQRYVIKFVSDLRQASGFLLVLGTTLCDKVCQWLAAGQWVSPCTSSTNKTDRHTITQLLLKVAFFLKHPKPNPNWWKREKNFYMFTSNNISCKHIRTYRIEIKCQIFNFLHLKKKSTFKYWRFVIWPFNFNCLSSNPIYSVHYAYEMAYQRVKYSAL